LFLIGRFLKIFSSETDWPIEPKLGRKHLSIRNKNVLWQPCLLTDRDEMSNLYQGPSIDASYQVRFIWPSGFGGEDFFKSAIQKQELPVAAMFVNGSG
jgi:hypothetical protein